MAEKSARFKQYEYKTNASLVIHTDRQRQVRPKDEGSGVVESLHGKIRGRMGDMANRGTNTDLLSERKKKLSKRRGNEGVENEFGTSKKKEKVEYGDEDAQDSSTYRPKTLETQKAYDSIVQRVAKAVGDQPAEVIRGAAEEVLMLIKDDLMPAKKKLEGCVEFLGPLDEVAFSELMELGRKITDFQEDEPAENEGNKEQTLDEEMGVAVVFDEEDEESEDEAYEITSDHEGSDHEPQDLDNDDDDAAAEKGVVRGLGGGSAFSAKRDPYDLDPKDIKQFWLKSQISQHIDSDPVASQKLAEQLFRILETCKTIQEGENQLMQILGFDKKANFEFSKLLLKNRLKIVYCTRLQHAENEEERARIEQEMRESPELLQILERLQTKKGDTASTNNNSNNTNNAKNNRKNKNTTQTQESKGELLDKDSMEIEETSKRPAAAVGSVAVRTKHMLDLEQLAFSQGGHLMANSEVKLAQGSTRKTFKGYEEVTIPVPEAPPAETDERLIPIKELPEWAQAAFSGMTELNRIQSRVFKAAFTGYDNLLLCAPTGAGKTNVAMLTIMRELGRALDSKGNLDLDSFKVVYIAPMKSLVQEMVLNFTKRLEPYGVVVKELSGDQNLTKKQIKETQIIVTTPEKWDIITRKTGERTYTQNVKLIIIDEIHLLHDDRGPVLESIVSRTLRQIETTGEMVRLVGLSATLPNFRDVAAFLRVDLERGLFTFSNSLRPCPLHQTYVGITEKSAYKRFMLMNQITYNKVAEQVGKMAEQVDGKNQILVFVHSRKETAATAKFLRDQLVENLLIDHLAKEDSASKEILLQMAEQAKSNELKDVMVHGIGIHHAGLIRSDRTLVEDLFDGGHLKILVSTATLAWGVNLPAHTVIIKGTQVYNPEKGKWTELSPMDIMQMLGRAGRPGRDTFGEGVLLTTQTQLQYYLSLMNQQLPIESQFIGKLPDHLNAEIVLGTVQDIDQAATWLTYTYLYVCMLQTPTLYGVLHEELDSDPLLEQRRYDLAHSAAVMLDRANLVKYNRKTGALTPTDLGVVASHFYVTHSSMAIWNEHLKPHLTEIELFRLFALSKEFQYIVVRDEEKLELEKLLGKVPIPIKEAVTEGSAKINCLLQAYISRLRLDGYALTADMVYVTQSGGRLFRALFEICLKRGWAPLAEKCLTVGKCIDKRMWETQSALRQFRDVPDVIVKKIEAKEFPMERLYDLNSQEIGSLINMPQMGKHIYKRVHQFPRLELTAHSYPLTRSLLRVELTLTPDFEWEEKHHQTAEPFWIFVLDVDGEKVLHYEYFVLKARLVEREHLVDFTVPLFEPMNPHYFIKVVSDRWVNCATKLAMPFRHLVLPGKVAPHTELLDLQPVVPKQLEYNKFSELFTKRGISKFNALQTQTFHALFKSDANVFVGAPTGAGKTVCAEFALLRLFGHRADATAIYLAPMAALATQRYRDWKARLEPALGLRVVLMTGDATADLKLLESANIVVSTPEHWDVLSRRWKQRKAVQDVALVVADDLHLVGGEASGAAYEVVVSRMLFIAAQKPANARTRVVGLASAVANGKDLADWLGVAAAQCFNFHPSTRPTPLEVNIKGFDTANFGQRMATMSRPAMHAVARLGGGRPTLVFVPNRKTCRLVARDLLQFADPQDPSRAFARLSEEQIKPYLKQVTNRALAEALTGGVGLLHDALTEVERETVRSLFAAGALGVLVVTHELVWGLDATAGAVVVMGTQVYDGREHKYVDYPISTLLKMVGRAQGAGTQEVAQCTILCYAPRKEFYKKFLDEPYPVESQLDRFLPDHFNAEIFTKTITNKQAAVDYLTWTFLYRRVTQNPNYYNVSGNSNDHISDYLSELVEQTLTDLEQCKCIAIEEEMDVFPLNLGIIATYYDIRCTTIELFDAKLSADSKLKDLIELLASAAEFENIPIRHGEDRELRTLIKHCPVKIEKPSFTAAPTKVNVLLQTHFDRTPLPPDMAKDQAFVLEHALRLLQAMVDVISSSEWLGPALAAMELSQMIVQACWQTDSQLKQLPHFTPQLAERAKNAHVDNIFDLTDMDNTARDKLLRLQGQQLKDVIRMCNRYPSLDMAAEPSWDSKTSVEPEASLVVTARIERDSPASTLVMAPFFPKEKLESWWVCLGDPKANKLKAIKRLAISADTAVKLDFDAPEEAGRYTYSLYAMCDSYLGADQEVKVDLIVQDSN